jgi:hypothetical protein
MDSSDQAMKLDGTEFGKSSLWQQDSSGSNDANVWIVYRAEWPLSNVQPPFPLSFFSENLSQNARWISVHIARIYPVLSSVSRCSAQNIYKVNCLAVHNYHVSVSWLETRPFMSQLNDPSIFESQLETSAQSLIGIPYGEDFQFLEWFFAEKACRIITITIWSEWCILSFKSLNEARFLPNLWPSSAALSGGSQLG